MLDKDNPSNPPTCQQLRIARPESFPTCVFHPLLISSHDCGFCGCWEKCLRVTYDVVFTCIRDVRRSNHRNLIRDVTFFCGGSLSYRG